MTLHLSTDIASKRLADLPADIARIIIHRKPGYEEIIDNELKSELDELRQRSAGKDGECPPCPPCDRCPEPVFSCEKVINYRSPSVGQYLPMPVLGDFSTFKE